MRDVYVLTIFLYLLSIAVLARVILWSFEKNVVKWFLSEAVVERNNFNVRLQESSGRGNNIVGRRMLLLGRSEADLALDHAQQRLPWSTGRDVYSPSPRSQALLRPCFTSPARLRTSGGLARG